MRIAIATPTGHVGRNLVRALQDEGGYDLVLLARDPGKLVEEQQRGATVAQGTLEDEAYVTQATAGANALFVVIPPDVRSDDLRGWQGRVAGAAANAVRTNHVENVVLLSSMGAHVGSGTGPIDGLHDAERIVRGAAARLTILRPGYFMENFEMALPTMAHEQAIYLPVRGHVRVPMIATRDIAEAAARALVATGQQGARIMPLHGARDYSFDEAAAIITEAVGHPVRLVTITYEQARKHLVEFGVSENVAHHYLEMYEGLESGRIVPEIARGRETTTRTTFETFAKEVLAPALRAMEQHV